MKVQKKKLIDVNELVDRLNASNVPYCAKINSIIKDMPTKTIYEYEITISDCRQNSNGNKCNEEPAPAYVQRMIAEYHELKDKYTKLHSMLVKHKAGTLDFEPTCPIELLEHQANVMDEYLYILEVRAEIENVEL